MATSSEDSFEVPDRVRAEAEHVMDGIADVVEEDPVDSARG